MDADRVEREKLQPKQGSKQMKDLERRALLGDQQAQEECTRQKIVLRCGCGAPAKLGYVERDPDADFDPCHGYIVKCQKCDMNSWYHKTPQEAVAVWNNRAAPPIGRCKDCAKRKTPRCSMYYECQCGAQHTWETDYDFCSEFEPKGDGENGED